jgi:hypothetical protein
VRHAAQIAKSAFPKDLWLDRSGKIAFDQSPVDPGLPGGTAGALADGVKHAKTDTVAKKSASSFAIEFIANAAIRFPRKASVPNKVDLALAMLGVELNSKGIRADFAARFAKHTGHCRPIAIADRGVDAAKDFTLAETNSANETTAAVVEELEGACAQGLKRERFGLAPKNEPIMSGARHDRES